MSESEGEIELREANIAVLKKKRSTIKGSISRLETTFVNKINVNTTLDAIKYRLEYLERLFVEFCTVEDKLLVYPQQSTEAGDVETKYFMLKEILSQEIKRRGSPDTVDICLQLNETLKRFSADHQSFIANNSFNASSLVQEVKLPRINIPPFSGEYDEFVSFKDLYEASIHNNTGISNVHKCQYLRGLLRGEASNLIKHITISDANYDGAYNKLVERYDKKHQIMSNLIKRFLDQATVTQSSFKSLRNLANTSDEVIRGLAALGSDAEKRDPWLITIVLSKCDLETKQAWADKFAAQNYPSFDQLMTFLNSRCDAMESCDTHTKRSSTTKPQGVKSMHTTCDSKTFPENNTTICSYCKDSTHRVHACPEFKNLSISARKEFVQGNGACFNCLTPNHNVRKCFSKFRCNLCKRRHHTLLHEESVSSSSSSAKAKTCEPSTSSFPSTSSVSSNYCETIYTPEARKDPTLSILKTAVCNVSAKDGKLIKCRVLLDSGGQASFISERFLKKLHIPREKANILVSGIASSPAKSTKGSVRVKLTSRFNSENEINIHAYILPELTSALPSKTIDRPEWSKLSNYNLADPAFYEPSNIDILIGMDYYYNIIQDEIITVIDNSVYAQKTIFGYVIAGSLDNHPIERPIVQLHFNVDDLLKKFWEIEEPNVVVPRIASDIEAEKRFTSTTTQLASGRFVVRLPFISNKINDIGLSLAPASRRLFSIERKYAKDPVLKEKYQSFMDEEYLQLGHMRRLDHHETKMPSYYLPHHAVFKNVNGIPKIRVVFDGSAKTSTGISINECMLVGPTIQPTLWATLLRFRTNKYGFVADLEKMYRQILIHPEDRKYQRIVWRRDTTDPISHYELNTVTYGTIPASFLAVRTLHEIANKVNSEFPDIAKIIRRDFYVDDLLSGADTIEESLRLKEQLSNIFSKYGFNLRDWKSNESSLSNEINHEDTVAICENDEQVKILGLQWKANPDVFTFKIQHLDEKILTKRIVLSETGRIFDPMGWLSPSIIIAKILMQRIWLLKADWDEILPEDICQVWLKFRENFMQFEKVQIPRFINVSSVNVQLHGFSDASNRAYAAVVYCRTESADGTINIQLVTSKTKVAPLKAVSTARLELCGAHLLTKCLDEVTKEEAYDNLPVFAWTDSTTVLAWISDHPIKWTCFIANRVTQIIEKLPRKHWNYVASNSNPADDASRGVYPEDLVNCDRWWNEPPWLSLTRSQWPKQSSDELHTEEELRVVKILHQKVQPKSTNIIDELIDRYSDWNKLVRVLAYCLRVLCPRSRKKKSNVLDAADLISSKEAIFKHVQSHDFKDEIAEITKYGRVIKKTSLYSLTPFLDNNGILRVKGRLSHSSCNFNQKHPVILHSKNSLSRKIVESLHKTFHHPGPSLLFHLLRQQYWVVGARVLVRNVVNSCVTCSRFKGTTSAQIMGDLPSARISTIRAFHSVGVDYAGPITLMTKKGRGAKEIKAYLAIFVCMSTKATHIEVVSDLTTDAFISALRRFCARRGIPGEIWSDNATNFKGARTKISEIYQSAFASQSSEVVNSFVSEKSIKWNFIPPRAAHFGGLWESAVKSTKHHLYRATNTARLTFEEMSTLTAEIEAILNSRPLCPLQNEDESNLNALTPGHFLLLQPPTVLPEQIDDAVPINRLSRYDQITQRVTRFWTEYSRDYLNTLQQRTKWRSVQPELQVGDVVTVKDENLPPCRWPLARIVKTHPGADNKIRAATIKTSTTTFKRPITRLRKLPIV